MTLRIDNPQVEQKAATLAGLRGTSVEEAIQSALDESLVRAEPQRKRVGDPSVQEVMDLIRSFDLKPINDGLTEDEILGYGPDGYCV